MEFTVLILQNAEGERIAQRMANFAGKANGWEAVHETLTKEFQLSGDIVFEPEPLLDPLAAESTSTRQLQTTMYRFRDGEGTTFTLRVAWHGPNEMAFWEGITGHASLTNEHGE